MEQHRDFTYKTHQKFQLDQLDSSIVDDFIKRGPRTTSLSASDEGIVMDYSEEMPRKKKVSPENLNIQLKYYLLQQFKSKAYLSINLIY